MKRKVCNLLKLTTGLELCIAAFILCWFLYNTYLSKNFEIDTWVLYSIVAGSVLQIVYTLAIIQMMLHYIHEPKAPQKSFFYFFKGITVLNVIVAAALVCFFIYTVQLAVLPDGQWTMPHFQNIFPLCIMGSYAVVSVYTLAGAAKLKKAILYEDQAITETWLEQLGRIPVSQ